MLSWHRGPFMAWFWNLFFWSRLKVLKPETPTWHFNQCSPPVYFLSTRLPPVWYLDIKPLIRNSGLEVMVPRHSSLSHCWVTCNPNWSEGAYIGSFMHELSYRTVQMMFYNYLFFSCLLFNQPLEGFSEKVVFFPVKLAQVQNLALFKSLPNNRWNSSAFT